MENENKIDVSVILPVYNEAKILRTSLLEVKKVMEQTRYKYEIIIAEDASTDGTDVIAKELSQEFDNVTHLHRDKRYGRGSAVANAILNAKGPICGYLDTDLETPVSYIPMFIKAIEKGADIASGVRNYKVKPLENITLFPKLAAHYVYAWLSKQILKVPINDIESGCKFFRREAILPILKEIKDQHWFWDTEVMVRPYYKGYKIKEVPVVFNVDQSHESKVNLIKDSIDHIKGLLEFRRELKREYWKNN